MNVNDLAGKGGKHALRLDALTYLAKEALAATEQNRVSYFFECGSGLSTVVLGRVANKVGGHVFTLEHSSTYAMETERLLIEHRVAHRVSIVLSPLVPTPWGLWYRDLPQEEYDFAFIDGPPLVSERRRAALHRLDQWLKGPAIVDDAETMRPAIDSWCSTLGWSAEYLEIGRGGMARMTR